MSSEAIARLTSSRAPPASSLERTTCRKCDGQCDGGQARVLAHSADLIVFNRVKNTIGTQNLEGEMSGKKHERSLDLTMAKSSASLTRGKISGVADTMGLREASPKPRDVANMPVAVVGMEMGVREAARKGGILPFTRQTP